METLIVIAIIFLMGGVSYNFIITALHANNKNVLNYSVAVRLLAVDSFIRAECDNVHIPYWDTSAGYVPLLVDTIGSSRFTNDIKNIETITDDKKRIRGIRVFYSIEGKEAVTDAIFASVPVMEYP